MAKAKKKQKTGRFDQEGAPTAEQMVRSDYRLTTGVLKSEQKYRRVPVIDTMLARRQISDDEHRRLTHYRDQAALAERSLVKSCLDHRIGGSDLPLSKAILSAQLETARIERDLGSLRAIARAVAVDDKSLAQWCVDKFGGRERYDGKGRFVAMEPIGDRQHQHVKQATLEIRMAAHRIAR